MVAQKNRGAKTWVLEDHVCRSCGGRILRSASGAGPTPGGNPVFMCSDCEKATSAMGPDALCWCGFSHRRMHPATAYKCLHTSLVNDYPRLAEAFRSCGCDPARGGVGVVLEEDYISAVRPAGEEK